MRRFACVAVVWLLLAGQALAQFATGRILLQNAAAANGNGTAASTAGYSMIGLQIVVPTGASPTYTINFEQSLNENHYVAALCLPSTNADPASSAATTGVWRCNVSGTSSFRARVSGYTGPGAVTVIGLLMAGGAVHAVGAMAWEIFG